jgi:2-polyprenyl-3-methyl-5-hydroxy-6-metoxy-1,4-benzoquinol methylase
MNIINSIYYVPYLELLKSDTSFSDYAKGKSYYTQLAPLFDAMNPREEFTKKEVDFLIDAASSHADIKIESFLDIACGTGRHLKGLAQRGYSGFGIDASRSLLEIARKAAPNAELNEADMRFFKVSAAVDCAYSLWDSYVYLSRKQDIDAFARRCSAYIKQGGILILDSKNYQTQQPDEEVAYRTNNHNHLQIDTVVRRKKYPHDKVYEAIFTSVIQNTDTGEAGVIVDQTLARIYSIAELEKLLKPHGFRLAKCYGNFDKTEYDPKTSDRMIAVFKKC